MKRTTTERSRSPNCIAPPIACSSRAPSRKADSPLLGFRRVFLLTASEGRPLSPLGLVEPTGPAWFLATDCNADGCVSRREFLGPPQTFRKLDADSDELLSPIEAAGR